MVIVVKGGERVVTWNYVQKHPLALHILHVVRTLVEHFQPASTLPFQFSCKYVWGRVDKLAKSQPRFVSFYLCPCLSVDAMH